jgi:hypothetical protein
MDMQRFVRRKQWCEEQLRLAETDPNFRLLRRTHGGGQIDLTETHKRDLRDARDEYQRAIDYLEMKATGAIPAAHESARTSRDARRDVIVRSEHVEILGALAEAPCTTTA